MSIGCYESYEIYFKLLEIVFHRLSINYLFRLDMANKKKGQLTSTSEWAKHLRKYLKRQFWKGDLNLKI